MKTLMKYKKRKQKLKFLSLSTLLLISFVVAFQILFSMSIQAEEQKLKASKQQVQSACNKAEGNYYENGESGAYGCVRYDDNGEINATIDCDSDGNCIGWRKSMILRPGKILPVSDFYAAVKSFRNYLKSNPAAAVNLKGNNKLINEANSLIRKNRQGRIKSKREAIKDLKRLSNISKKIHQNLKIQQGLQRLEIKKDPGKVGSVAQINLSSAQRQFKTSCQVSGGYYVPGPGLGKCCWQNWGCLQCQDHQTCTMHCETQACKDAQTLSPELFRQVANEMELVSRESSNDDLNRLTGYKEIKNQFLAIDRKTDKFIKEGRRLIKKTMLKCCRSKEEILKTHNRLLEIVWEIRHNLKKRKALLNQLHK